MPLIGMYQKITVTKAGVSDGWGDTTDGAVVEYKARVTEQTKVVVNNYGEEAVSSMTILVDKLPDISYDDTITYTNELGVTIERKPIAIKPRRMVSSRVVITEVNV
ncbi:hypothetical protein [Paenibacillus sp. ACRRY]|uniref:hypothetical protein n=1 Tax=Paenibacillus sp. ACRRY TaxID=2918208 RepID=UPI001EF4743E|nr:hypothetical protein [Paenibacillus sp. ACRRY]MCG7386879.1 hypothetical protein [Paenibacillus sp. ACRRY]